MNKIQWENDDDNDDDVENLEMYKIAILLEFFNFPKKVLPFLLLLSDHGWRNGGKMKNFMQSKVSQKWKERNKFSSIRRVGKAAVSFLLRRVLE